MSGYNIYPSKCFIGFPLPNSNFCCCYFLMLIFSCLLTAFITFAGVHLTAYLLSLPKISMAFWNSPLSISYFKCSTLALVWDWKSLHEVIPLTLESRISIIKAFSSDNWIQFILPGVTLATYYATGIQQDSLMEVLSIPMADRVKVWQKTTKFCNPIILQ